MSNSQKKDFCVECRKKTPYVLGKKPINRTIREKEFEFNITTAECALCGQEMSVPGIIDLNVREIDEQYRKAESLVRIEDILRLMKIYNMGKAPLSYTLGFGEITITRYLAGQIPSKEYSDVIKSALVSPQYMKECLGRNKNKIADTAYNKALDAVANLEQLFSVSEKMIHVIAHIFKRLDDVSPLLLQKLLYFTQGISLAAYNRPMFDEECEAWVHGPVYPKVYNLFKDFKFNPIEDDRFALIDQRDEALSEEDVYILDMIINTFGIYSGKTLERITHKETPWQNARRGYEDTIPSHEIISKNSIKEYYVSIFEEGPSITEDTLREYIHAIL